MEIAASDDASNSAKSPHIDDDQRVYLVPYKWWKESQDSASTESDSDKKMGALYSATQASSYSGPMKLINTMFNSDLIFNLRREGDVGRGADSEDAGVSGQEYALVSGDMWLQALKRHSGRAMKRVGSFTAGGVDVKDVYPLQIRLVISREPSTFGIKIIKKDNAVELFKRACRIFNVETQLLRIWDFSGRINMLSSNEKNDLQRQSDQEIPLELQIYGLSDSIKCKEETKDDSSGSLSNSGCSSSGSSAVMNGSSNTYRFPRTNSSSFTGSSVESGSLGLAGLQNLGNTCFMNSALQCLAHTPKLVDYFLGDYPREINNDNPLGMNGEIALAFGDLIRKLWAPGASPVAPRPFKSKLARFAPQFSGFNQHDSQELLAFLLDGLHEDLNRVKCKPYFEAKDGEGRPDEEVADEYWQNHLARNDSIIVDVCQGQYRSTLICPMCKKVSITFDPFMYLTLPLPSSTMRSMTLTVMHTDGKSLPCPVTVSVPKLGNCEDLTRAVTTACSLGDDELLLIAEVYNLRIVRLLEEPTDSLSLIRDDDRLVAYRLPKNIEKSTLVFFWHQQWEEKYLFGKPSSSWKSFGIPMLARIREKFSGSDIYNLYPQLLKPFAMPSDSDSDNQNSVLSNSVEGTTTETENGFSSETDVDEKLPNGDAMDAASSTDFEFFLADEKGVVTNTKIEMHKPIPFDEDSPGRLYIVARWPEKKLELYDTVILSRQPEIFKSGFLAKRPQESTSLYKCLEAFLNEEPLGPEDMWYCPGCKEHRQATKKLDLWRLPEILVIHLKRFSYNRYTKNKLESYVDFPIDDLNLSNYIANKNYDSTCRYVLYAISNHYGGMGSGHYTAFVHHGGGQWYDFDDSRVSPISKEKIKTSAAYLLFYRRIADS